MFSNEEVLLLPLPLLSFCFEPYADAEVALSASFRCDVASTISSWSGSQFDDYGGRINAFIVLARKLVRSILAEGLRL